MYIGVMIKILFEFDCFFTLQDDVVCKKSNSFLSGGLITGFIKFSASDNAFLAFCLVRSISVISSYTLVWPYMENTYVEETKFLSDKVVEKSRFCELSANKTTKKLANAILSATKKPWWREYSPIISYIGTSCMCCPIGSGFCVILVWKRVYILFTDRWAYNLMGGGGGAYKLRIFW